MLKWLLLTVGPLRCVTTNVHGERLRRCDIQHFQTYLIFGFFSWSISHTLEVCNTPFRKHHVLLFPARPQDSPSTKERYLSSVLLSAKFQLRRTRLSNIVLKERKCNQMITLINDRKRSPKCSEKPDSLPAASSPHGWPRGQSEAANQVPGEIPMEADGAAWRQLSTAWHLGLWVKSSWGPFRQNAGYWLPAEIHQRSSITHSSFP